MKLIDEKDGEFENGLIVSQWHGRVYGAVHLMSDGEQPGVIKAVCGNGPKKGGYWRGVETDDDQPTCRVCAKRTMPEFAHAEKFPIR